MKAQSQFQWRLQHFGDIGTGICVPLIVALNCPEPTRQVGYIADGRAGEIQLSKPFGT